MTTLIPRVLSMIDHSDNLWDYIAFGLLWAVWTAIFMLAGWGEGWSGDVLAGLIMTFVTYLPLAVIVAWLTNLAITIYEEFWG